LVTAFAGQFSLPRLDRVISGIGALHSLESEVERVGAKRVVVVTGRTLAGSELLSRVTGPLGSRRAAVFAASRQHVPASSVTELVALIQHHDADCLVSLGGGSPIDTAKLAVHARLEKSKTGDGIPHIAIPTTLSAAEFTSVAGITDDASRIKHAVHDARLSPRVVIADPTMTLDTPRWLWAATGVRAIDHAVESMYSNRHHPFSDATAMSGLSLLLEHLPASMAADASDVLEHRAQCQIAAWMAVFGMTNAGFGLSHALGHQIGPKWNVAHGVTSCITLPHAMRFMADLAPERFAPIAAACAVPFDAANPRASALACADRLASFIASLGVPTRLRDVGVPEAELGQVAAVVHGIMEDAAIVGRPVELSELEGLLRKAF
jgi:alcohol dehydrogenase class IV